MPVFDLRDFDFLNRWLSLTALLERARFAEHRVDDVHAILALAAKFSERELAPHLRAADQREPRLEADGRVTILPDVARAVRLMADSGFFSTVFDAELGGLQLPHMVHAEVLGILMSGNLSTASFVLLTVGNARLLATYGTPAQIEAFAQPQICGQAMGTMCLSEPQAGSSLGDIRTHAVPEGADALGERFRITGNKMWISGGDHDITANIVHLVLAKVPDAEGRLPDGSEGISLFIVPKRLADGTQNDVQVAGLNHKMGYRGLPNCALNFGEGRFQPQGRPGAVGWLVGRIGQGLPQMFHMMNEARISVGLAASMLACRGYAMSLAYARERRQGRPAGAKGGDQVRIIDHPDVRRMLLAQKAYSQGALSLVLFSARLLDEETTAVDEVARADAGTLLALLTPVTKTWPSEWAQLSLHHALQVHGGAGYTRDFEIELLYRDNRLNPIHEGTTGIQGIDLVGRKLRKHGGRGFSLLVARIHTTIRSVAPGSALVPSADAVGTALRAVQEAVAALLAEPDHEPTLAHATVFLQALGHLVVGWLWLDQAIFAERCLRKAPAKAEEAFLTGRITSCLYFAEAELPLVAAWLGPLLAKSTLVLGMADDQF